MRFLAIIAVLCVAVQSAQSAPADKVDCSKLEEVIDDLGAASGITQLNDKYPLPITADELAKRCSEATEAMKTLRKYNKECYSSLTQQVFSAIIRTRSQFNENVCKADSAEGKAVVEAMKCLKTQSFESGKEAEKKILLQPQILHDMNIADDKLRMRRLCCAVLDCKPLLLAGTKDKCSAHAKVYGDYVDSYTSEAMGLVCLSEEKLKCGELEALKTENVPMKSKFFLNPMLKLVKTLDN